MKVTYTGRADDFPPAELTKAEHQIAKLSKLLDGKEESEAHVRMTQERHLHNAEITVNYHNHSLVGIGTDPEAHVALHAAIEKLEKQALKVRAKWRSGQRGPGLKDVASDGTPAS
jgi:ribosomal subunit interface protein